MVCARACMCVCVCACVCVRVIPFLLRRLALQFTGQTSMDAITCNHSTLIALEPPYSQLLVRFFKHCQPTQETFNDTFNQTFNQTINQKFSSDLRSHESDALMDMKPNCGGNMQGILIRVFSLLFTLHYRCFSASCRLFIISTLHAFKHVRIVTALCRTTANILTFVL